MSRTSDTVGICIDHTRYHWDSNADGALDAGDAILPPCAALPVHGTATTLGAVDLGCVTSATATLVAGPRLERRLRLGIALPALSAVRRSR